MDTDSIARKEPQKAEQPASADLVVAILVELDADGIATICDGFRALPGAPKIAVLREAPAGTSEGATSESAGECPTLFFAPTLLTKPDAAGAPVATIAVAYQSVFAAGEKLNARGCCVIASKLESANAKWANQMAQLVLGEQAADLVVPRFARRKFEGLLNGSIIAPLTRCLYGKRIQNPMGPDVAVSQRLYERVLTGSRNSRNNGAGGHPLISLAPSALCANFEIREVHTSARVYPPADWTNVSSILAQVLGPIFSDMERNASCWQRTRSSTGVMVAGMPERVAEDKGEVDIAPLVDSFQLGNRDLAEIWGLVLPPSTMVELRKMARLPVEQFRMADELWVRIVCDFALAHRMRTINRDHLLKSITPLYLGWVASYAHDMQEGSLSPDQRLERVALAYEAGKPYLVSRWRWPERFNP
jgi:glucosylglycerate synthase